MALCTVNTKNSHDHHKLSLWIGGWLKSVWLYRVTMACQVSHHVQVLRPGTMAPEVWPHAKPPGATWSHLRAIWEPVGSHLDALEPVTIDCWHTLSNSASLLVLVLLFLLFVRLFSFITVVWKIFHHDRHCRLKLPHQPCSDSQRQTFVAIPAPPQESAKAP